MTDETPKRPWRRRRGPWAATAAVVLVAGYASIAGPLRYALVRGWVPPPLARAVLTICSASSHLPLAGPYLRDYERWWAARGYAAAGYHVEELPDGRLRVWGGSNLREPPDIPEPLF